MGRLLEELGVRVGKARKLYREQSLGAIPTIARRAVAFIGHRVRLIGFSKMTPQERFESIYKEKRWMGNGESLSGMGSTLDYTENFRSAFEEYLQEQEIGTLFDAPCGDMNWMNEVRFREGMRYIGGDIVPHVIEENRERFASERQHFEVFDITRDTFPEADLWLCRDCLFHLCYEDIFRALRQFARSEIAAAMITNHLEVTSNRDIVTGESRLLDLTLAPFHLPEPDLSIEDWLPGHPKRVVNLWRREAIAAILPNG